MYNVTVTLNGAVVDSKSFPYGKWMEVAFWIDNHGYSEPRYTVTINYTKN